MNSKNPYTIKDVTLKFSQRVVGEVSSPEEAYKFMTDLIESGENYSYPYHSQILAFDVDEENDAADIAITNGHDIKLLTVEKAKH